MSAVMRIALSTNWSNLRLESGRAIAEEAASLGFDALELGFNTTAAQAKEIRESAILPVDSIHAFCPVPISAPSGHPELYRLASFDENERAVARVHVKKNIAFASEIGATVVVLHAGRIERGGFFAKRRSRKLCDVLRRECELLEPELERRGVVLALENLPYEGGFPDAGEIAAVTTARVRPWHDTGHGYVRDKNASLLPAAEKGLEPVGFHINDSIGGDDHLPPGEGLVDFAAMKPLFARSEHLVFEPNPDVTAERLRAGLELIRAL